LAKEEEDDWLLRQERFALCGGKRYKDLVELLLVNKADVNAMATKHYYAGETALHFALRENHT
jgi:Ankyrin repeats (3 copies)